MKDNGFIVDTKLGIFIAGITTALMLFNPSIEVVAITIIIWMLACTNIVLMFFIKSTENLNMKTTMHFTDLYEVLARVKEENYNLHDELLSKCGRANED